MKIPALATLFALCIAPLAAQAPAAGDTKTPLSAAASVPATPTTHADPVGFSYTLPADWQLLDMQPAMPAIRQRFDKDASSEEEKKGLACAQVTFTARHGDPPSVIVAVTLPFDCWGTTLKDNDLPGFAVGTAGGLKKSWNVIDPQYSAYTLGGHSMWIERATGNPLDHPESKKNIEVVCSILKKGAVCWMAFAADDASMKTFEQGSVTLDDDAPAALVPASAFSPKP
ncbi:MAG: hypothetical protein ACRD3S_01915 [Terracidiphilus sp.]